MPQNLKDTFSTFSHSQKTGITYKMYTENRQIQKHLLRSYEHFKVYVRYLQELLHV